MSDTGRGTRRVFFALWPGAAERQVLATAYGGDVERAGGRPVPPGNLHLTLEFLGAVARTGLESLRPIVDGVALPSTPVVLDEVQWWRAVGALVAVATAPPPEFLAAQAELRQRLVAGGFAVDGRPFRPHVTLARKVTARPPLDPSPAVVWSVAELALVESVPAPGGSRYRPLSRWRCVGERAEFLAF